ncbi:MAG: phosphoribosylamine--glycine ligase [Armatimonadota bacterium]|nr:phosphoribosylamine--glycine ligase [Armatimonadota bacterium]MDR7437625.1 phosphoribosylamine--glycine ligase [Armatimonadota bacterium]MDR7472611.1 phosphoribosylamine--glycine ligase [Armatimonadota bacterium]MDR7507488.1 phosphoribosylamine--glycine ligase [Armatimonadota bacterium]MDR7510103.1 phosphoribosylamine--glycine ligase [Armatimonadota bacterium]
MKVLVVGSGGREHALAWALSRTPAVQVYAAPGNPGIARVATCLPIAATDLPALAAAAEDLEIDLTVVGPEQPLSDGIADLFASRGLRLFGPSAAAARVEASKAFAKDLMRRWGIPTAAYQVCDDPDSALRAVRRAGGPVVIKADGLAAGKGVVVARTRSEAERAVEDLMVRQVHGAAGRRVVVEECLEGEEASVLALVSGAAVWPLLLARDYKRAGSGDTGPNTGGMGALAPALLPSDAAASALAILHRAAEALAAEGSPFVGVLYAGVMVTRDGVRVLEFNCRFGDPEAQVILPLVEGDLAEAMIAILEGGAPDLRWTPHAAVCVVAASRGYPGPHPTGYPITGLDAVPPGTLVFHAGTALREGRLVTAGGRVLHVVGVGATVEEARARAYAGISAIGFEGMQYRTDIGAAAPRGATVS